MENFLIENKPTKENGKFDRIKLSHVNKYYTLLSTFDEQDFINLTEHMLFERKLKWSYIEKVLFSIINKAKTESKLSDQQKIKINRLKQKVILRYKHNKEKISLLENQAPFRLAFSDDEVKLLFTTVYDMLDKPDLWSATLYDKRSAFKNINIIEFSVFSLLIFLSGMRSIDVYDLTVYDLLLVFFCKSRDPTVTIAGKNGNIEKIKIPQKFVENTKIKNIVMEKIQNLMSEENLNDLSNCDFKSDVFTQLMRIKFFTISRTQLNYLFNKLFNYLFSQKRTKWLGWHAGRRWFIQNICNYTNNDNSLNIASKLVGHNRLKTTQLYRKNALDDKTLQSILNNSISEFFK